MFNTISPIIDLLTNKLISRKLLAFGLATYLLANDNLTSGDWTIITCIYIGVQGAIDFWKVKHSISP